MQSVLLYQIARVLHIGGGVFWVGGIMFMNIFVGPSIGAAGPAGAAVMAELLKRNYFKRMIHVAYLTILAGLYLVYYDSAGFQKEWFGSPMGRMISTGMLTAIIALVIAIVGVKPAMEEAFAAGKAGDAAGLEVAKGKLKKRGGTAMLLLILTVIFMSIARAS